MRTIKISLGALVILFALWLLPRFISLQSEVALVEKTASQALGVPVQILQARVALLPSPRLTLEKVTIAAPAALEMHAVVIKPQWSSVFSATKVVDVAAQTVTLTPEALAAYPQWMMQLQGKANATSKAMPMLLGKLNIAALTIAGEAGLPPLALSAQFEGLSLTTLLLMDQAESLRLQITPQAGMQRLTLSLKQFVWANAPQIKVDQGELRATLSGDELQITSVDLSLLGGQVTGEGRLRWQPKASVEGRFTFKQLALAPLLAVQAADTMYLSGQLSGQGMLKGTARDLAAMPTVAVLEADAKVTKGVLHGIDLSQVSRLLMKQDARGDTQFDVLTTHVRWQDKQLQFKPLMMQSGLLRAQGQFTLGQAQLAGEMTVALRNSAGLLEVPLEISGPVSSPSVLPTKAALLGAAVGTALLPGVGTGLGLKAGSQLNAWFAGQP